MSSSFDGASKTCYQASQDKELCVKPSRHVIEQLEAAALMELYATHLIDDLTALELPSRALSTHASVQSRWSAPFKVSP